MDKSTRRLPPGPKGHFLLGNLPEFGKDLLGFITQCARVWGYREAAACQPRGLSPESPRLHGVRPRHESPQLRQELVFLAPRESGVWERPPHERGDFWLRERRLCQPAFHREQIAGYGTVMVDL